MGEVARLAPGRAVAAQGEHVLDPGVLERRHVGVDVGAAGSEAGEVRERGHAQVALDGGGDGHGVCRVAGPARGVGDRDRSAAISLATAYAVSSGISPLGGKISNEKVWPDASLSMILIVSPLQRRVTIRTG